MDPVFVVMVICTLNGHTNKTCIHFHLNVPETQHDCELLTRAPYRPKREDITYRVSCQIEQDAGNYGLFFDANNKDYKRYYSWPFDGNAPKSDEVTLSYIAANQYDELFCADKSQTHFKQLSCRAHAFDLVTYLFGHDPVVAAAAAELTQKLEASGRAIDAGGPLVGIQSVLELPAAEEKYAKVIMDAEYRLDTEYRPKRGSSR